MALPPHSLQVVITSEEPPSCFAPTPPFDLIFFDPVIDGPSSSDTSSTGLADWEVCQHKRAETCCALCTPHKLCPCMVLVSWAGALSPEAAPSPMAPITHGGLGAWSST